MITSTQYIVSVVICVNLYVFLVGQLSEVVHTTFDCLIHYRILHNFRRICSASFTFANAVVDTYSTRDRKHQCFGLMNRLNTSTNIIVELLLSFAFHELNFCNCAG